jgi:hypothetical protein
MAALGGVLLGTANKTQANDDDSSQTVHKSAAKLVGLPPPPHHIRRGGAATAVKAPRPLPRQALPAAEVYLDMNMPASSHAAVEGNHEDPVPLLNSHSAEESGVVIASSDVSSFAETSFISKSASRQAIMPRDMLPPSAPPPQSEILRVDGPQRNFSDAPILKNRTTRGKGRNITRITAGLRGPGSRFTHTRETELPWRTVARLPTDTRSSAMVEDAGISSLEGSLEKYAEFSPPSQMPTQAPRKRDPSSWIEERRIDINGDGDPLTKVEFKVRYGGSIAEWESSPIKR